MRNFALITVLCLAGCASATTRQTASAKSDQQFQQGQATFDEFCKTGQFNQPGYPNFLLAIDILSTEAKVSACALRKKLVLTNKQNLYMRGFRQLDKGNEFTYLLVDFSGPKPAESNCVATSHFVHPEGGSWDAREEIYDVVCNPAEQ